MLTVRTGDYGALTRSVAPAAQRAGVSILEMRPADESLESVFSYLVRR
jgi:ABC-2 type transport system ATP-binding protein